MFTGIVTQTGQVKRPVGKGNVAEFEIKTAAVFLRKLKLGDSVCVNGVCLTVAKKTKLSFTVQAVPETLQSTNLDSLENGNLVNLEPSCRVGDELGGYFVTGHVDAVGRIAKVERGSESLTLQIQAPEVIIRHLIVKGSIALDGISLTVQEVGTDFFKVAIIPYTFKHTNLKAKSSGDPVNLEADLFAKYIRKYVQEMSASPGEQSAPTVMTEKFLKEQGF